MKNGLIITWQNVDANNLCLMRKKKRNTIVEHLNTLRTPNSIVALLQNSCTLSEITSTSWDYFHPRRGCSLSLRRSFWYRWFGQWTQYVQGRTLGVSSSIISRNFFVCLLIFANNMLFYLLFLCSYSVVFYLLNFKTNSIVNSSKIHILKILKFSTFDDVFC